MGHLWDALTKWYVWQWPGWVALAAIGTVGAFFVLIRQTSTIGRQLRYEIRAREQAEEQQRVATQQALTPYLSVEAASASIGPSNLFIEGLLHADGDGVAHNIIANISRLTDTGPQHMNTQITRYIRAANDDRILFVCHHDAIGFLPFTVRIDVSFANQFDQQVQFYQSGKVTATQFTTTDAPHYTWPWDKSAPVCSSKRKAR